MKSIEQGGSLDTVEMLPFNYFYEHIIPQYEKVVIDDSSFDGIDPRRLDLPDEAVLLRAIIDIDPHVGGYFIAVAQVDTNSNDHDGVAAYKISLQDNTFTCDGRLTFIGPEAFTWFGAEPKAERQESSSTMQLTEVSREVSDTHIGLTVDEETGSLIANDVSENRTWRLSLKPEK